MMRRMESQMNSMPEIIYETIALSKSPSLCSSPIHMKKMHGNRSRVTSPRSYKSPTKNKSYKSPTKKRAHSYHNKSDLNSPTKNKYYMYSKSEKEFVTKKRT